MTDISRPKPPSQETKRGRPHTSAEKIAIMKKRIAEEARGLFLTEGYRAVSMRRIAAGVGCSPMSLYTYYPAKIDILWHLWTEVFDDLFSNLAITATGPTMPIARLQAVSRQYVDYWLENSDHYRMVFMTEGITQPQVSTFVGEKEDGVLSRFELFFALVAEVTSEDAQTVTQLGESLICSLNGIAHCLITMSGHAWSAPEKLIETIVSGLFGTHIKNA